MNRNEQPTPTTYLQAFDLLQQARPNKRHSLKIAPNTYLEPSSTGYSISVRFHATDIVTFYEDGTTELNCNGYRSKTTLERVNRYIPFSIYVAQRQFAWFVFERHLHSITADFFDGIKINSVTGEVR